jgi:ligand-binding sensor domain-containing protein
MHRFLSILLALSIPAVIAAQTPAKPSFGFRRISVEHGLPSSRVNVILQTRDGIIWFGTREGFCKYENGGVTVYAPNAGGATAANDVRAMYEDRAGILWIGLFGGGVYRYDRVSGKLSQYRADPSSPGSLSDNRVLSILEDEGGTLWIGTVNGLNTFDRTNLAFTTIPAVPGDSLALTESRVWPLSEDRQGSLWIGTLGGGLNRLDRATGVVTAFRHDPASPNSIGGNSVVALHHDRSGRLWIGLENGGVDEFIHGLDEFDRPRMEFRHHLHGMNVSCIDEDSVGNILVGTIESGLKIIDRNTRVVTSLAHDPSDPRSIGDNAIRCMLVDRKGVLWLGTDTAGVSVVAPEEPRRPARKSY